MRIKRANTKPNTFPPPLPYSTSLQQSNLTCTLPSSTGRKEDGGWSMHYSSTPFPSCFFPTLAWVVLNSCSPSGWTCSAEHGFSMGCKEQLLWSLEPPSWPMVPSLVSHSVVLPPPISLLCYLPFLECVSSAAPLIPQRHHQVPRWAELWCTESAAEVAGSGCDRH